MKVRLMTVMLVVFGCGLSAAIMSCDGDGVANAPSQPTRGNGKGPQVLNDDENTTLAVTRSGVGDASLDYNSDDGVLTVEGLGNEEDGISSTFDPAHNWQQDVTTAFNAGSSVSYAAYNGGDLESDLDISRDAAANSLTLQPEFHAGDGNYNITIYNDGAVVATYASLASRPPVYVDPCAGIQDLVYRIHFQVRGVGGVDHGECAWRMLLRCCNGVPIRYATFPVVIGDEVRFQEVAPAGDDRYPYHTTDRIDVNANTGSYTIDAEYAGG